MLGGSLQCERAARLTEYINWLCVGRSLSTNEKATLGINSSLNPKSALMAGRGYMLRCVAV